MPDRVTCVFRLVVSGARNPTHVRPVPQKGPEDEVGIGLDTDGCTE